MLTPTFAEEDCEEPIVRTLLDLGDDRDRSWRSPWRVTSPATVPRSHSFGTIRPALHYHLTAYRGGFRTDHFGRFDTLVEAETFANDPTRRAGTGGWRPSSAAGTTTGRRNGYDPGNAGQAPQSPKHHHEAANGVREPVRHGLVDEDGEPFEVFGHLGKGGSFQNGVTELACRLISLHLRRGTPLAEIIDQMQGISEMQPFWNQLEDGRSPARARPRRRHRPRPQVLREGREGEEGDGQGSKGGRMSGPGQHFIYRRQRWKQRLT